MRHPRLATIVVSLGAGLLMLALMPAVGHLKRLDLRIFELLSGRAGEVVGRGTLENPRVIEELAPPDSIPPAATLYLTDESEGYFERIPPPPADLMVVLARLQERGMECCGFGYALQWDEPDTLAVEAMRRIMDRSRGVTLGFLLKDSTAPEAVSAPFLRSSIPFSAAGGEADKLPVVNSIRGASPEYGGDRSHAGFTGLETEDDEEHRAFLLARWSDRIVFALPLALEILRRDLDFENVQVHVGREIRLGEDGPRIPIDFRGRADLAESPPKPDARHANAVIAETLPEAWPAEDQPLYFTDRRLLGGKDARVWAERLPAVDAAIRGAPRVTGTRPIPRPEPVAEFVALIALVLVLGGTLGARRFLARFATAVVWIALVGAALAVLVRHYEIAPMPLAFLAVPAVAAFVVLWIDAGRRVEVVDSRETSPAPPAKPEAPEKRTGRRRAGKHRSKRR